MDVIQTQSLNRMYGARVGIEGVNLSVPEGTLFGFLGPNGAGKTTTIRLLLGFIRPDRGQATTFGYDCWRDSKRIKHEVGYLPGDLRLYSWMTGLEALRIFGQVRRRELLREGGGLAEQFELDLSVKVRAMSRGMRQKLGLILAMAHRPKLLILDEPSASLDPLVQKQLQRCLREWVRAGHTVFFSSHSLSEVEEVCDSVAILRDGRLMAQKTMAELRSQSRRDVMIRWGQGKEMPAEAPPFITVRTREATIWRGELSGSATDLVRWAASQPIEDITIAPPDLDAIFRRYYEGER